MSADGDADVAELRSDALHCWYLACSRVASVRTLFITGATGFVGASLTLELLRANPTDRALCLVRGADPGRRLTAALRAAAVAYDVPDAEAAIARASAIAGDVTQPGLGLGASGRATLSAAAPLHVFHAAASLKDTEESLAEILAHNVVGTEQVLDALLPLGVAVFNHVSTAYVAGRHVGDIPEGLDRPRGFNNRYEQSKHYGEHIVVDRCRYHGVAWRILRPAIVVGHSRTGLATGYTGFLGWVLKLAALDEASGGMLRKHRLRYVARSDARLNIVPIDAVVEDTVAIDAAGDATLGGVFHLTNSEPPPVGWLVERIADAIGIQPPDIVSEESGLDPLSSRFHRWTRFERPYVRATRSFCRGSDALYASPRRGRTPFDPDVLAKMCVEAVADYRRSRAAQGQVA
jgi:nucleoside-diphosphate-sugar epimerase